MEPFSVAIDDRVIQRILTRVREFEWPTDPATGDWSMGTETGFLKKLQDHWLNRFDWRKAEQELNRFPQFKADVDGLTMHFLYEKGSGPSPMPLLLIHGWPGSTIEFHELIEPLAHPERFGRDPSLSFDVVVAALPGYGFSGRTKSPIGVRRTAAYMNALMTKTLGYDRYFAQGGDWGCLVGGWIGFDHADHNAAIHLNMLGVQPGGDAPSLMGSAGILMPSTPEEIAWAQDSMAKLAVEGAYAAEQSTRPQTIGYGLNDSPMGLAAWIVEKFHAWSDLSGRPLDQVYDMDLLLTNVMVYVTTGSYPTSAWMYYGTAQEGIALPPGKRVEVPVAIANFPRDIISNPPRSYVEKGYNVARWTDFPRGGHFAALEAPDLLLEDIRAFFPTVRDRLKR